MLPQHIFIMFYWFHISRLLHLYDYYYATKTITDFTTLAWITMDMFAERNVYASWFIHMATIAPLVNLMVTLDWHREHLIKFVCATYLDWFSHCCHSSTAGSHIMIGIRYVSRLCISNCQHVTHQSPTFLHSFKLCIRLASSYDSS